MSMALGRFHLCLNVKDFAASRAFYEKLDFRQVDGRPEEGWIILEQGGCTIGLFQGHIPSNLLNFRGGDVFAIERELVARGIEMTTKAFRDAKGCETAFAADPDGNVLMFDTCPAEKLE